MAVVEGFGTTCAETRFSSNHALQGPLCDKWRCNAGSRQAAVDVRQNRSLSALGYLGVESRFPWWTCSATKIPKATPYRLVFFACFAMCWCRFRARSRERHPFEPRVFTTAHTSLFSLVVSRACTRALPVLVRILGQSVVVGNSWAEATESNPDAKKTPEGGCWRDA